MATTPKIEVLRERCSQSVAQKDIQGYAVQDVSLVGDHYPLRKSLAMVSTRQKGTFSSLQQNRSGKSYRAPTKTCSFPGLRLQDVPEPFARGRCEDSFGQCHQVAYLLSLVAEL